jgi:glucose-6-phosphate isomerase
VHSPTSSTQCVSYWEQLKLNKDELNELLSRANKDDVAFSIASFSGTPVETIRAAIKEHEAAKASQPSSKQTARLGTQC